MAQAVKLKGPVLTFHFNAKATIGDLLIVVNQLEKDGKPPFLKFVGFRGEIEAVEVLTPEEQTRFELTLVGRDAIEEMAVAGHDAGDELPDPAIAQRARDEDVRWAGVTDETEVYFEGNWTTWGELAGNERTECDFNDDGVLVGSFS